jgi:hypothetical protein
VVHDARELLGAVGYLWHNCPRVDVLYVVCIDRFYSLHHGGVLLRVCHPRCQGTDDDLIGFVSILARASFALGRSEQ